MTLLARNTGPPERMAAGVGLGGCGVSAALAALACESGPPAWPPVLQVPFHRQGGPAALAAQALAPTAKGGMAQGYQGWPRFIQAIPHPKPCNGWSQMRGTAKPTLAWIAC